MIDHHCFRALLTHLGFDQDHSSVTPLWCKRLGPAGELTLAVDFGRQEILYPEAIRVHQRQTCNFAAAENAVVFECVHRLLEKGYRPEHIELEPEWALGHGGKSGRADILIRDQQGVALLIIECKTAGREFDKAWKDTLGDGAQLISYVEQEKATQFICLYASEFDAKAAELRVSQRVVSVRDNPKILQDNPGALAFGTATNARERFRVWKETYQQEFTETGIFEDNIQPYQIGKSKYTLADDTQPLNAIDIKGAYHRFRTVLRKHNVSRRENAFEVLVNLFVCKIVDETENPTDLKFYWKGIAYDNYFDLVDRLQSLYKTGMSRFLGQDIVYVSNDDIENAFWPVKNQRSAVRDEIRRLFRELKFFKGLDFEFIKVFNQTYFDKNAKILIEIIQMWQGLRLTGSSQNQFLGDMFEYFLDNGIKQSEGQFFTPVPICKFIVTALPLEQMIAASHEPLRAIDYACGSGHFLTEYASQLPPLLHGIKQQSDARPWFEQIYGIEKEDRLAKVAKVSAFMYGFNDIHILDADALVRHPDIAEAGHDILVANPPFAVEDFLQTVPESERERYTLLDTVNDLGNKNVQCFFLERARQLLKPGGVVGVVVPSSILSNTDGMHVATRQILLQYFDFVAITELGGGTFGKTGTNTVVLFLRRKTQRPEPERHFRFRSLDFFYDWAGELSREHSGEYLDLDDVRSYCAHVGLDFDAYQGLLKNDPGSALLDTELFKDYHRAFDDSPGVKRLRASRDFSRQAPSDQQAELHKRFLVYCRQQEQVKLYYFLLAHHNPTPVLLIKGPSDNKAQQQFLGYDWSGAKGQEGIRYAGGDSVRDIETPLFDPKNRDNEQKLSHLVRQNFAGHPVVVPASLQAYATQAHLVDLLDFGRVEFDAIISLAAPSKIVSFASKWPLKLLSAISKINPSRSEIKTVSSELEVSFVEMASVSEAGFVAKTETRSIADLKKGGYTYFIDGDILIAKITPCMENGKCALARNLKNGIGFGSTEFHVFRANSDELLPGYLFSFLNRGEIRSLAEKAMTGSSGHRRVPESFYADLRIPVPSLDVQRQIIAEFEAVDKAVEQANASILQQAQASIANLLDACAGASSDKLLNVARRVSDNIDPQQQTGEVNYIGLENIESQTGRLVGVVRNTYSSIKSAKTRFQPGDVLYGKLRPNLNKVYLAREDGVCSTDIYVLRFASLDLAILYAEVLRSPAFNRQVLTTVSGQQLPRTNWSSMGGLLIPLFSIEQKTALLAAIRESEFAVAQAQTIIDAAPARKQAILQKYL